MYEVQKHIGQSPGGSQGPWLTVGKFTTIELASIKLRKLKADAKATNESVHRYRIVKEL